MLHTGYVVCGMTVQGYGVSEVWSLTLVSLLQLCLLRFLPFFNTLFSAINPVVSTVSALGCGHDTVEVVFIAQACIHNTSSNVIKNSYLSPQQT